MRSDVERDGRESLHREALQRDARRPVYHISVVAEMLSTHPQTLRLYERLGLVSPQRTAHNTRLYSDEDVETVRRIQHLTQDLGVNLAGVEVIFKLLAEMEKLRARADRARSNGQSPSEAAGARQTA